MENRTTTRPGLRLVALSAAIAAGCGGGDKPSGPAPSAPAIRLEQTAVGLTGKLGVTAATNHAVQLTNGGTGSLTGLSVGEPVYSEPQASGWLTVSLSSSSAPANLSFAAFVGTLSVGTYSATVSVSSTATGLTNGPIPVTVTFTVVQEPVIAVSNPTVLFEAMRGGGDPQAVSVTVSNAGTGTLDGLSVEGISYDNGEASAWLTATLGSGTAPAELTLSPSLGSLPVGAYSASVRLTSTSSGVRNSPRTVSVTFLVLRPPTIQLSAATIAFNGTRRAVDPAARTVNVTNLGTGTLSGLSVAGVSYATGQPGGWLVAALDKTTAPAVLTLSASTAAVPAGNYTATIAVNSSAPLVEGSPHFLTVTFVVAPAPPRLSIVSAPVSGETGTQLGQAITVRVLDGEEDIIVSAFSAAITASFPVAGALTGRTSILPTAGEAVFDSLVVNAAGTWAITFASPGAVNVTTSITVAPPPGGTMVVRPTTSTTFEPDNIVRLNQSVEVRDAEGALVGYPVQVRAIVVRGTGLVLSGDTTTSVNGVATFPVLRMSGKPEGFTAEFIAPGFTSGTRDYFLGAAAFALPRVINGRDSVVARDSVFGVDVLVSSSLGVLGSLRFDIDWDPELLTLVRDSVLTVTATVLTNGSAASTGSFAATLSATSGFASGARLIRLWFKVVSSAPAYAAIGITTVEARTTAGTLVRGGRANLTVRIP